VEALVPAFIVVLLTQIGDRSPWLVAILADRYERPLMVAFAALLAHLAGIAIAAIGAALIAPMMTPNAQQLLLALAFLFAAMGSLWRLKAPDRLEGWRIGGFATALFGVFILALGDTTQFFTLALGVRGSSPALAAAGAVFAVGVVNTFAALMGETAWRRLPVRGFRVGFGVLCLAVGAILAAGALRLI